MADKIMYIPNDDTQKYLFCWLQLVISLGKVYIYFVEGYRHLLIVIAPRKKITLPKNIFFFFKTK